MQNRDTKKNEGKIAERSTGRVGPFPYHRAGKVMAEEQKLQAAYAEQERKGELTKQLERPDQLDR